MLIQFIFLMLVIAIALIIFGANFKNSTIKKKGGDTRLPYIKKPYLMTNAEREFFFVLEGVVQGRHYVVPQVQLSKVVEIEKGVWQHKYFNWINQKSVDFVLFDKTYFTPYLVIELDEISHNAPDRIKRDSFVDNVMTKAGMRIEHFRTAHEYNVETINKIIYG